MSWTEIGRAWDDYLVEQDIADRRAWRAEEDRKLRERVVRAGEKLDQMLNFPLFETTLKDGKTIVKPVRWGMHDLISLLRTLPSVINEAQGADLDEIIADERSEQDAAEYAEGIREQLLAAIEAQIGPDDGSATPGTDESAAPFSANGH